MCKRGHFPNKLEGVIGVVGEGRCRGDNTYCGEERT